MTRTLPVLLITLLSAVAVAQAETSQRQTTQAQTQEQLYGSQLMTPEERAAHRAKMRAAKTEQEREAIRLEHHKQMQARAKKEGVTLPDSPPAMGGGMGPGQGKGSGRGTGMGQGGSAP